MTRLTKFTSILFALALATSSLAADTSGCGQSHDFKGSTQTLNLTSSGVVREYLIHLPNQYNAANQYPVVLAFHGNTEPAFAMEADTGLSNQNITSDVSFTPCSLSNICCLRLEWSLLYHII